MKTGCLRRGPHTSPTENENDYPSVNRKTSHFLKVKERPLSEKGDETYNTRGTPHPHHPDRSGKGSCHYRRPYEDTRSVEVPLRVCNKLFCLDIRTTLDTRENNRNLNRDPNVDSVGRTKVDSGRTLSSTESSVVPTVYFYSVWELVGWAT